MPGKCKFQEAWLSKDIYKDWLLRDAQDTHFARCRACRKSIKLQTMGEAALTSHARGAGHRAAVRKLMEDSLLINSAGQLNGGANQAEDSKERVAICLQQHALDRITSSNWADLHHSPVVNSNSHNAELQDMTFPSTYFPAPGTSRLGAPRLLLQAGVKTSGETEEQEEGEQEGEGGRRAEQHDTTELSRLEHQQRVEALEQQLQMKILEWENRMKVLAWEQELVKERRKAVRQKEKAFRMKKAYYQAKLRRMGEDVPLSSSSSDEEDKTSDPTG